jgi:hypothetical protein
MGRELTKRHSSVFETKISSPFLFARDIYRYGKARELSSFVVWELLHRLRLFPPKSYLQFNANQPLTLPTAGFDSPVFVDQINHCFSTRGLRLSNSEQDWKLLFVNDAGELLGCLFSDARALYKSVDRGRSVVLVERFPEALKAIFVSSRNTIFVCVRGVVYKSSAGGAFTESLELASSESFFRHNNSMTETPSETLILGEYGNVWDKNRWRKLAYLYFSSDDGETWDRSDFLIREGANKHVHLVKYSKLLDRVFVADGDNRKKLWVSDSLGSSVDLRDPNRWNTVNKFHIQTGGYTSIVETDEKIVFGSDYQGGTNFIVDTVDGRSFRKSIVPDPYRRSPIDNMVQRKSHKGNEIWANLPYSVSGTACLLTYSRNGGTTWDKVIEYSRATHKVWLIGSSNKMAGELYFSIENLRTGDRAVYEIADA